MALNKIVLSDGVTELANVKSIVFKEAVNSGVDIRPGCVGSASIEVEVYGTQATAVSAGDTVSYYELDNTDAATLIGKFNAEPVIKTKNSYKFTAYDNAQKLEADFSAWLQANQSNFPMTVYALVSAACSVAGVTLQSSSWPLSTQSVQAFYADGLTCRQIVSYAAELAGRFVRCHADGKLYFDWYAPTLKGIAPSGSSINVAYKQSGLTYANFTTAALDGVAVHPNGVDDAAYIYPVSASGNLLHVTNNLLLMGADASFYNAAAQQIYTAVNSLGRYRPMTVKLFPRENPFRVGDIVAVTDSQGVGFNTPITGQTVNAAAAVLETTGREKLGEDRNTASSLAQLASDVVRINKLKVDWADIDTAIINYLTANDVTAQNLTIVDADGNVLATFNASGITLGETDKGHAFIDFNSFELFDADGNIYAAFGDLRDNNGVATVTETINKETSGSTVSVNFPITALVEVTVNGNEVTGCTFSNKTVSFPSALAADDVVVVTYETETPVYHYDLGGRVGNIGAYSVALGESQTASGLRSAAVGGQSNVASDWNSAVLGGLENEAKAANAVVVAGYHNTTSPYAAQAFVGGGSYNDAESNNSAIIGGLQNVSHNIFSVVVGGQFNETDGVGAVVVGGTGNKATGQDQVVHGKYNATDNNMAEIVGNGTSDTARSNARTLDWNGNEYIAGALSVGNPSATLSNLGGVPLVVLTNMTANTSAALLNALNGANSSIPLGVSIIQLGNSSVSNRALMICTKINATLGRGLIVSAYAINGTTVTLGSGGWT